MIMDALEKQQDEPLSGGEDAQDVGESGKLLFKCFYAAVLGLNGRLEIPQDVIDAIEDNAAMRVRWVDERRCWQFEIPQKRRRSIIVPAGRVIRPR